MAEKTDIETPGNQGASLQDKTLKAAGYGYMLGDISMVTAGLARRGSGDTRWKGTVGGAIIWFLGGIAAAVWGSPKPEVRLKIQASKLEKHLQDKGADITDDARAGSPLLKKKTFLWRISAFLYEHPSELLNSMYGIGAGLLVHDGWKSRGSKSFLPKTLNAEGINGMNTDFWIGAMILAGAATGLLVKEDPDARKKAEHKGPLAKAYAYIAEKPLRVTGALYGLNNVFLGAKAIQDYHYRNAVATNVNPGYADKKLKPHMASITQFCAYVFSNTMLLLSRRDQVSDKAMGATEIAQLENAAAQIIAAQTPEKQKALLTDVSEYMAQQKGMRLNAPEIAQQLANRITLITQERLQSGVNEATWVHREAARQQAVHADVEPVAAR